jgi:hypothetical protein
MRQAPRPPVPPPLLGPAHALALWEQGRARHAVDRALLLLGAVRPGTPWDELADLPVGRRDAALLALRRASFGTRLEATTGCVACGEALAFELDLAPFGGEGGGAEGDGLAHAVDVEIDGCRYRRPTSRDLAAIANETDAEAARRRLLTRCGLDEGPGDAAGQADRLARVEAALAAADAAADITLELRCQACGTLFEADFDIAALLWQDIEAAARRALRDVDLLARAYGWSEREVLALSDTRRAAYVELASR